ncbi:hypothetical protein EW146_g1304 [Bondarzewia mesenterica]|uniref:Uncharacterized protein n=1 Tax=Bondarzewia mesenterica TaxID=1095465 RepID=A0A4S4M452_9AGAM|nr:hypothetical protein EW146_g1304 [Bondarzewia mesenterica]
MMDFCHIFQKPEETLAYFSKETPQNPLDEDNWGRPYGEAECKKTGIRESGNVYCNIPDVMNRPRREESVKQ